MNLVTQSVSDRSDGMRVSVVLCTFNGERYIEEQLTSIGNQTRPPDEVIVCDDASDDHTISAIEAFSRSSELNVRVCANPTNFGVQRNFEQGIRQCSGDIIFLADQDDIWTVTKVERQLAAFSSERVGMVFSDGAVIDDNGTSLSYSLWESFAFSRRFQREWRCGGAVDILLRKNVVTGATMAFRAELKQVVLPFGGSWVHDAWIAMLASIFSEVAYVNAPLVYYRQHGKNLLGAEKRLSRARIRGSLQGRLKRLRKERVAWCEMLERLGSADRRNHIRSKMLGKIAHLERRIRYLERSRAVRSAGITKEWLAGDYHRYGQGTAVALLDLLYQV